MPTRYRVVRSSDFKEFSRYVTQFLAQDWVLHEAPTMVDSKGKVVIAQALTKTVGS